MGFSKSAAVCVVLFLSLIGCPGFLLVHPAAAAATLPPLPVRLTKNEFAIRVIANNVPVPIDDVTEITIEIEPNMNWSMGPKPEVLVRYADGWVTVDKSMFTLAKPGQKTEMRLKSAGQPMSVSGVIAEKGTRRVEYHADPAEFEVATGADAPKVAVDEVAGRVVDPDGKPIAGATVSLPRDEMPGLKQPSIPPYRPAVTTDAAGEFRFTDFARQWYMYLQVESPGFARRRIADLPLGKYFTIKLDNQTRLAGQILAADGSPAGPTEIRLITTRRTGRELAGGKIPDITQILTTDDQGKYDLPVEPGEYELRLTSKAGEVARHMKVQVPANQITALPAKLTKGFPVTLRAVDSQTGKPIVGATFWIGENGPGSRYNRSGTNRTTDADGRVTWAGMTAGRELIETRPDDYSKWWLDSDKTHSHEIDALFVDFQPNQPELLVKMEAAVKVTGRVVGPDGKPVAGAEVDIANLMTGDARYARRTDTDGRFKLTFPDLSHDAGWSGRPSTNSTIQAGEYAIIVFDTSGNWANVASDPFTPKAGETHEFKLQMTLGGRVCGQVVGADGKPVAGIEVEAVAEDGLDRHYYNPRQITDANGHYDLGPMRPATYAIQADTHFGVNIMHDPEQKPLHVTVSEGEELGDITITYNGPPPPAPPKDYFLHGGNRRITATTRPAIRN